MLFTYFVMEIDVYVSVKISQALNMLRKEYILF